MEESGWQHSYKLLTTDLFSNYSKYARPTINGRATEIAVLFFPVNLLGLDEKSQTFDLNSILMLQWTDRRLIWNSKDYGGIGRLHYPQNDIWLPPLVIYPSTKTEEQFGFNERMILIDSSGSVYWELEIHTQTLCEIDVSLYPFDTQECTIKLRFRQMTDDELKPIPVRGTISEEIFSVGVGGTWQLLSIGCNTKSGFDYTTIFYTLTLRRKTTFYVLNIVTPVIFLSFTASAVFMLPADSGEKMGVSITVLLSYSVYLSIIADDLPKTSNQVCYLQVYLTCLLGLTALGVLLSVLVLKLHHTPQSVKVGWKMQSLVRQMRCFVCFNCEGRSCKVKPHEEVTKDITACPDESELFKEPGYISMLDKNQPVMDTIQPIADKIQPMKDEIQPITWQHVAETLDMVIFIIVSSAIVLSTVTLFPYLAIAGSSELEAEDYTGCLQGY